MASSTRRCRRRSCFRCSWPRSTPWPGSGRLRPLANPSALGVNLTGPTVRLREFGDGDLEAIQRYGGDPEVVHFLPWGPNDIATSFAFLQAALDEARQPDRSRYQLAVIRDRDDDLIGAVSLQVTSWPHRRGELGYVLRRDAWGRGHASEAARLMVGLGLRDLQLHRIEATCAPANRGSIRVLEKVGLRFEGTLRDHLWLRDRWCDSHLFAILEP